MELLAAYSLPAVIFHGYTGSPQQTERLFAAGYYLSVGPISLRSPKTEASLREAPLHRLFIETDDSDVPIEQMYTAVGALLNIPVPELKADIYQNFKTVFPDYGVAYAAEMICRAGVGSMTIADADTVSASNINRQLVALTSTIGQAKTSVLAQRLLDINPDLQLRTVGGFIKDEATYTLLDSEPYTYVVDAIDTLSPKAHLIKGCLDRGIPVVSSMGAGAKTDPTKVEIEDIARTHHCPLAHMLRKRLHKMGIHTGFQAVFSAEKIREGAMIIDEQTNKKSNTGTISYMPAVFGCCCASVVVRDLIGELR